MSLAMTLGAKAGGELAPDRPDTDTFLQEFGLCRLTWLKEVTVVRPGPDQTARLVNQPATRELVPATPGASARWHTHDYPGPYCRWHYHPEHEIHLIRKGTGTAIVGDHVGRFSPGHFVLVGSNLPHHWISDLPAGERIVDRDVVLQLHPDWLTECQRLMPELATVQATFDRAARGIEFSGDTAAAAAVALVAIGHSTGTRRLTHLLDLLTILDEARLWALLGESAPGGT